MRTQAALKGAVSRHLYQNSEIGKEISPNVRESIAVLDSGFHAVDSGFQALDFSGIFCQWNMDSGLQSFLGTGSLGLYAGFQSPSLPIPQEKLPGFPFNKRTKWHLKRSTKVN